MRYTAKDHAFVYGVIAEELLREAPERTDILEAAVKAYGLQRGERMAQTAEAFGDARTMQMYLAYGEWAPEPGEMEIRFPEASPSAVWHVYKCPWRETWEAEKMLDVGKYYCQFVDRELVHGFNPDLKLGTGATQTNGGDFCYFKWTGADMTPEHKAENAAVARKVGRLRLRSWAYHCAHIYKAMGEVIAEKLGAETRSRVYGRVDRRLEESYGATFPALMHAGLILDYHIAPSCKPVELLTKLFETETAAAGGTGTARTDEGAET